jgi:transposase-like protein
VDIHVNATHNTHMATKKKSAAKAAPSGPGRQPDPNSMSGKARELLQSGMSVADIAKKLGCKPGLVYNVKARMGGASKKPAKAKAPKAAAGKAAKSVAAAPASGIEAIIAAVKGAEAERARLRSALEKMAAVIAQALSGS